MTTARTTVRDRIAALLAHPRLKAVTTDEQIRGRLLGLGIHEACSRCGGSGHYSFTPRYGTTCFGCHGKRYQGAKLNKATEERLRKAVEAGELDAYADLVHRRAAAKRALQGASKRMRDAYAASEWYRYHYLGEGHREDCSHVNALAWSWPHFLHEAEHSATMLVEDAKRGTADPEVALAAVAQAIATVARMDRAHAVSLPRYAECRAEADAVKALPFPARFDAEVSHRAKWTAIAAGIWAAVEQPHNETQTSTEPMTPSITASASASEQKA